MGKKRIIQKTDSELIKESQLVEDSVKTGKKAKTSRKIERGRVYINATYNNTMVTVTNEKGDVVSWMSAGSLGFSGPKKATPFAASKTIEAIAEKIKKTGPFDVDVFLRGIGKGRASAIRTLFSKGFNVFSIKDVTPIPHNGPRPPKPRRT